MEYLATSKYIHLACIMYTVQNDTICPNNFIKHYMV